MSDQVYIAARTEDGPFWMTARGDWVPSRQMATSFCEEFAAAIMQGGSLKAPEGAAPQISRVKEVKVFHFMWREYNTETDETESLCERHIQAQGVSEAMDIFVAQHGVFDPDEYGIGIEIVKIKIAEPLDD